MTNKMPPVIETASGGYFNFKEPHLSDIKITDIAHALSNLCRYTGHVTYARPFWRFWETRGFYSVAQHSVMVSRIVPQEYALEGLLHDAAEAYLGDVSSPLKSLLPDYKTLEQAAEQAICDVFEMAYPFHPSVKQADLVMLATERDQLLPDDTGENWEIIANVPRLPITLRPVGPQQAEKMFLRRFKELI